MKRREFPNFVTVFVAATRGSCFSSAYLAALGHHRSKEKRNEVEREKIIIIGFTHNRHKGDFSHVHTMNNAIK